MGYLTDIAVILLSIFAAFLLGQFFYFILLRVFKVDKRNAKPAGKIANYLFFAIFLYIGLSYVLSQPEIVHIENLDPLVAAFGILGIAAAFASQQTVANIFASVIIGMQKSLNEGDIIEVDGKTGQVKDINLLSVVMKTFDGKIVNIPKSFFLSNDFVNYSSGKVLRVSVPLQVSTKTSIEKINQILLEICLKDKNILPEVPYEQTIFEQFFKTSVEKKIYNPDVIIKGVSADFFSIELLVWIYDIKNKEKIVSDLQLKIFEEFKKEGIELKTL